MAEAMKVSPLPDRRHNENPCCHERGAAGQPYEPRHTTTKQSKVPPPKRSQSPADLPHWRPWHSVGLDPAQASVILFCRQCGPWRGTVYRNQSLPLNHASPHDSGLHATTLKPPPPHPLRFVSITYWGDISITRAHKINNWLHCSSRKLINIFCWQSVQERRKYVINFLTHLKGVLWGWLRGICVGKVTAHP